MGPAGRRVRWMLGERRDRPGSMSTTTGAHGIDGLAAGEGDGRRESVESPRCDDTMMMPS